MSTPSGVGPVSFPPSPLAPPGRGGHNYGQDPHGPRTLWKERADGRTVFRHPSPLLLWWAWVVFALVNIFYLLIDDLTIYSVRGIAGLLTATGVCYACTLHSRVETDADGVTIYNPVLEHRAPWGAVEAVSLGDSVEFSCRRPGGGKPKKFYSWALYSSRRSRARSQMGRSIFPAFGQRATVSSRAPVEAAELAGQKASQIMMTELSRRAEAGRDRETAGGEPRSAASWLPVAAIVAPALFLLIAFLA